MTNNDPPVGRSFVDLPPTVEGPFDVFVNGVPQKFGVDYELDGRTLVFPRLLVAEREMTKRQWLLGALGISGSYSKHDSIDITYEHQGRKLVATSLKPRPDPTQPDNHQTV